MNRGVQPSELLSHLQRIKLHAQKSYFPVDRDRVERPVPVYSALRYLSPPRDVCHALHLFTRRDVGDTCEPAGTLMFSELV